VAARDGFTPQLRRALWLWQQRQETRQHPPRRISMPMRDAVPILSGMAADEAEEDVVAGGNEFTSR
jgi:hypothetical protein